MSKKSKSAKNKKPKLKIEPMTILFLVLLAMIPLVLAIDWKVLPAYRLHQTLSRYNAAKKKCNHEPYVVIEEHVVQDNWTSDVVTDIYQPTSLGYKTYKAVYKNDIFGPTKVLNYYCTLQQAKSVYPTTPVLDSRGDLQ